MAGRLAADDPEAAENTSNSRSPLSISSPRADWQVSYWNTCSSCIWPIWAYMKRRSTQHALNGVAQHCKQARDLLDSQRPSVINRSQQLPQFQVCGAVQLFVDLHRAFDAVDRVALFSGLHDLPVNPAHASPNFWHIGIVGRSTILPKGGCSAIFIGSGVRQGCKATPWLFSAFLVLFLHDFQHGIPPGMDSESC